MMRSSDTPLLKRKPSEYMREMYYSNQPMEAVEIARLIEELHAANPALIKRAAEAIASSGN